MDQVSRQESSSAVEYRIRWISAMATRARSCSSFSCFVISWFILLFLIIAFAAFWGFRIGKNSENERLAEAREQTIKEQVKSAVEKQIGGQKKQLELSLAELASAKKKLLSTSRGSRSLLPPLVTTPVQAQ